MHDPHQPLGRRDRVSHWRLLLLHKGFASVLTTLSAFQFQELILKFVIKLKFIQFHSYDSGVQPRSWKCGCCCFCYQSKHLKVCAGLIVLLCDVRKILILSPFLASFSNRNILTWIQKGFKIIRQTVTDHGG